jgi:hypothetical protein
VLALAAEPFDADGSGLAVSLPSLLGEKSLPNEKSLEAVHA